MIPKVRAGQPISAKTQNKIIDQLNRGYVNGASLRLDGWQSGVLVRVINESAVDLTIGSCVALSTATGSAGSDPHPYPDDPARMAFGSVLIGSAPAADGDDWCIVAEFIPAGASGMAYLSGIILARLRDEDSTDTSVTIATADDWWHLQRGADGAGKVVWVDENSQTGGSAEPDTAPWRWALVRFPFGGGGGAELDIVQAVADGSAGSVSVKSITLKAVDANPNYVQAETAQTVKYFHL